MNQMINIMLNQLKIKNPQTFNKINELMKTNNNPQDLLRQVTSGYSPEQAKQFQQFANNMGISNEQLNKYGINI